MSKEKSDLESGANKGTKKGVALVPHDTIMHSSIDQSKHLVKSSWAKAELNCRAGRFSGPTVTLVVLFPYLTSAVIVARKAP